MKEHRKEPSKSRVLIVGVGASRGSHRSRYLRILWLGAVGHEQALCWCADNLH